jgi:hypothetical protein
VLLTIVVAATACSSSSSSQLPTLPLNGSCPPKPHGGALCVKVFADKGVVSDLIGYLASANSPLKGKRWRLVLTSYQCDPGIGAVPACRPAKSFPAAARHGVPPVATFCRQPNGQADTSSPGCHNTLATEYASMGAWRGFPFGARAYPLTHKTWLCVSEQIASGKAWTSPPPAQEPSPIRACAAVAPA